MKTSVKRHLMIFAAMAVSFSVSCESQDPQVPEGGQQQPQHGENEYLLDGEAHQFGSVEVANVGEYLCIAATPAKGVEDFDSIFGQEEYFYVAVSPLLNGKEFDLMTENDLYTVMSTISGVSLEELTPTMKEEITSGTCLFNYAEGTASVSISLVLKDGTEFSAKMSAESSGLVVNENIYAIDGVEKPVRAAFSLVEDGITCLYLTPAGISYFEELEIASSYVYIMLDDGKCDGRTLTIDDVMAAGYVDNASGMTVDSGKYPVTGTLNVEKKSGASAHYAVYADLDFSGISLKLRFDGSTVDANLVKPVPDEVIYEGKPYAVKSVSLKKVSAGLCTVMLSIEDGRVVEIHLPVDFIDGNAHGFSQSADLYMTFDGRTYSKASGYSGTVTVGIVGDVMRIEATNYDNLEITYEGSYEEIS